MHRLNIHIWAHGILHAFLRCPSLDLGWGVDFCMHLGAWHFACIFAMPQPRCIMACWVLQPKHYITQHADLYGKTRVKRTTERAALCVYAVFLRIPTRSVDFTCDLPCKLTFTIICIFSRVLPVKSQLGSQNRPQNGSQIAPESS